MGKKRSTIVVISIMEKTHIMSFSGFYYLRRGPNSFEIIDFPDAESWTIFDKNRIYSGNKTPQLQEYLIKMYGKQ